MKSNNGAQIYEVEVADGTRHMVTVCFEGEEDFRATSVEGFVSEDVTATSAVLRLAAALLWEVRRILPPKSAS
jgi:hypothetical protein